MGYELAAEYTYPEAENLSGGVLNIANNVYGILLVLLLSFMFDAYGDISVHVGLCLTLFLGLVLTVSTDDEKKRQEARKTASNCVHDSLPQKEFYGINKVNSIN